MSSVMQRDYYTHLFSPDSEDEENIGEKTVTVHKEDKQPYFENLREIMIQKDLLQEVDTHTVYRYDESSDMSLSSGDSFQGFQNNSILQSENGSHSSISNFSEESSISQDSVDSLASNEIVDLLRDDSDEFVETGNMPYVKALNDMQIQRTKGADDVQHDIIGSFNIQNKYCHTTAAKLFLEGEFTFLSLQEPFASHTSSQKGWGSCRRLELQSARISCFETHHQIVMYDAWRWGGKTIRDFKSDLNGRIVSVAFQLGNEKLGIISIYAVAGGGSIQAGEEDRKAQLRETTVKLVQKIYKSWRKQFPAMHIVVLGDMQETVTKEEQDNLGKFRSILPNSESILHAFNTSHCSIVRDRNPDNQYLTRFGVEGARGIDHILIPDIIESQTLFHQAKIDPKDLGSFHFPSDHKLIQCTFLRRDLNNAEETYFNKETYEFKKISSLKMKRSENSNHELVFDTGQFKGSKKFRDQKELYDKLQQFAGNAGSSTKYHLPTLEARISSLYSSLWELGLNQQVCGRDNKLVDITEHQAAELATIVNAFDHGIKDTMTFMGLSNSSDKLSQMAVTRKTVKLKGNFKLFSNLPLSTKLRYVRCRVQGKHRRLQHHINEIKRFKLQKKCGQNPCREFKSYMGKWQNTLNTHKIEQEICDIYKSYSTEREEREDNVDAITAKENASNRESDSNAKTRRSYGKGNFIQHLPEKTINLINSWLISSKCKQMFHKSGKDDRIKSLRDDVGLWKEALTEIPTGIQNSDLEPTLQKLEKASKMIAKYIGQLGTFQKRYRDETVLFLIQTNSIEAFTRKVSPKSRDLPAAHSEIWDGKLKKFRACHNEFEELIATGAHHGHWMDNSAARENCAFATIKKKGLLGARGITLNPNRKVTKADLPNLVNNGEKLPAPMQKAFVNAHGEHTARLFRPPKKDHMELYYPFYLENKEGQMHEEVTLKESFIKGIIGVPGKARYEGFHMAVIGRFGSRWQTCLFDIIKLILLTRFIPKKLRKIARFPIPKPGKANEYRPISLCQDIYCFINGISTTYSSKGIQKAGILHQGITAYVKGKGCTTLVGVEQGIREDAIESGKPLSQTDEDEEKFFDRISVEVLLAAMRVNGFPVQGFLELKASGMESKTVEIFTNKGVAHAKFVCGLEQGNPDSPTIANLVIKFKHDIWLNILRETQNVTDKENRESNTTKENINRVPNSNFNMDAYKMHIVDPEDGIVEVDRIGYCDDNSRYTCSIDEKEVIHATAKYIQFAGDLSLVTKIGRKGSKSEIHYFNLSAEVALALRKVESVAWSFLIDGPKLEKVPYKVFLQENEEKKAFQLAKFKEMDESEQNQFLLIFKAPAHKHLGLKSTLSADSSEASHEVINKIKARMTTLNIQKMEHQSQQLSANMLCISMHSYATLQMDHQSADLIECDNMLIQRIRKRHGLSETDAKHPLFIRESLGGFGFKSFLDTDLIATARELEILLNGGMIDSKIIRSRTRAYLMRHDRPGNIATRNFTGAAIRKIARYGFHVRDTKDGIINYVLSIMNEQKRFQSIGTDRYSDGKSNYSSGKGNESNLAISLGSQLHIILRRAIDNEGNLKANLIIPDTVILPTSQRVIGKLLIKAKELHFSDRANMYNCWEWDGLCTDNVHQQLLDQKSWKRIDVAARIKSQFPSSYWKLSSIQIHQIAQQQLSIKGRTHIMEALTESLGPAFIATDGAHRQPYLDTHSTIKYTTTGAAVLCLMDIRKDESLESGEWMHRTSKPIFARATVLPNAFGTDPTDIAHGEAMGLCIGLEMMHNAYPSILIMDSLAVRDTALTLRSRGSEQDNDRKHIRKEISGTSKSICTRMMRSFQQKREEKHSELVKMTKFLEISKTWTAIRRDKEGNIEKSWAGKYWDSHDSTPILKVDSHQLQPDGESIKTKRRYHSLIPNLFMLHCNHVADKCADLLYKQEFQNEISMQDIILPESTLRFVITWNGRVIDRHIPNTMSDKFQLERVHRLQQRATQGLPWRMVPDSSTSWKEFKSWGGLYRSICGFTNTHTRGLYKSTAYRNGIITEYQRNEGEQGTLGEHQNRSISNWNRLLSYCPWCPNHSRCKGNRFHTIFFCQHEDLQSYRSNMMEFLEQKLFSFIQYLHNATNASVVNTFLCSIEAVLHKLHNIEIGDDTADQRYRDRQSWMREENIMSWSELLSSTIPIYGHIFGFFPVMERPITSDKDLNRGDGIALGLIPKEIISKIKDMCKSLSTSIPCRETCDIVKGSIWNMWNEITEIHRLATTGLHRIAGNVCKERELAFKRAQVCKETDRTRQVETIQIKSNLKNGKGAEQQSGKKSKRVRFAGDEDISQMKCTGITCNMDFATWHHRDKPANKISYRRKHCVRCSKQQTAIRKCITILEKKENRNIDTNNEATTMTSFFDNSISTPNYKKGAEILKLASSCATLSLQSNTKKGRKRGTPDLEKLVINTLGKSIARSTDKMENPEKRICLARTMLLDTNNRADKFLKNDLKRKIADISKTSQEASYDKKLIKIEKKSKDNQPPIREKIWPSKRDTKQDNADILTTLRKYEYMEGRIMNNIILNLRYSAPKNVFIANADAFVAMKNWEKSKGWASFAGSFRSAYVSSNKPNGVYLIPIFSGPSEAGHWTLAVIHKQTKSCRGWIIDSLGTGEASSSLAAIIKEAFSKAKVKCRWQRTISKQQTEAECGARTVMGMVSICSLLRNKNNVEHAIAKVTGGRLWSGDDYQSRIVREKATEWIRVSEGARRLQAKSNEEMRIFRKKSKQTKVRDRVLINAGTEIISVDSEDSQT